MKVTCLDKNGSSRIELHRGRPTIARAPGKLAKIGASGCSTPVHASSCSAGCSLHSVFGQAEPLSALHVEVDDGFAGQLPSRQGGEELTGVCPRLFDRDARVESAARHKIRQKRELASAAPASGQVVGVDHADHAGTGVRAEPGERHRRSAGGGRISRVRGRRALQPRD